MRSRSVGVPSATIRTTRGFVFSVMRLIVPPLPAVSRPSKTTTTLRPVVDDPLLEADELGLEAARAPSRSRAWTARGCATSLSASTGGRCQGSGRRHGATLRLGIGRPRTAIAAGGRSPTDGRTGRGCGRAASRAPRAADASSVAPSSTARAWTASGVVDDERQADGARRSSALRAVVAVLRRLVGDPEDGVAHARAARRSARPRRCRRRGGARSRRRRHGRSPRPRGRAARTAGAGWRASRGRRSYRTPDAEALAHRAGDRRRVGQEGVLERRAVGHRRLVRREDPRVVEVVQALLGDGAEQAGRPAAGARALLDGEQAVRARDGLEHRVDVERAQRAQVDHLRVDAVLLRERVGGRRARRRRPCRPRRS